MGLKFYPLHLTFVSSQKWEKTSEDTYTLKFITCI